MIELTWQGTPADIEAATMRYLAQVDQRLDQAITEITALLQREARGGAIWTDRTGAARAGLTSAADVSANLVRIYLFHTASYGVFLELAHAGRYAVVMVTIERLLPTIFSILQRIFQ